MFPVPTTSNARLGPQTHSLATQAFFTKNHPKREAPQHATAARLANARANFFRLLSPSLLQDLRASNEAACRLATDHQQTTSSPCVIAIAFTLDASPPLCHLHGKFSKDLQTNFPETFRACSGIHRSCFTFPRCRLFSRIFTSNAHRPNTCPPQELQTKKITRVTVCHLRFCRTYARPGAPVFTLATTASRCGGWR